MTADFEAFYEAEAPRLVRVVAVALADPAHAEDAVAEAFVKAFARWPQVRRHPRPDAWVLLVALNDARGRFRRRRVERRHAPVIARPDDLVDPEPSEPRLWTAVKALPRRERELVALRYVADLSQAEIAKHLGIPPGTVASGLSRARQRLSVALGHPHEEDLIP